MKRSRERQMEAEEAWAKRWEQLDAKAWRLFSFHESKFKEKRASHLRELYQEKYQGQINSQSYEYAIITRSWFMPKIITVKTDWIGHCCRNYARFCEDYSFLFDNISFQFQLTSVECQYWRRISNYNFEYCTFFVIVFDDRWKYFSAFYIFAIFNDN